ncbi:MAG: hypothetical protein LBF39_02710 [Prevotellaceae bacterium]|nr:hypothetical protein [Prevotellaceae bacterium]
MKRLNLVLLLCLLCAGQPLYGQWKFSYMCGLSSLQYQGGYPTKSVCEAAAKAMNGRPCDNGSGGAWGSKIIVTGYENDYCYGTDLPVSTTNNAGQSLPGIVDFEKKQQITGVVPTNPYDELLDGAEEYRYWDEAMFGETQNTSTAQTGDKEYDEALQQVSSKKINWKGGRPGSAEGMFNYFNNASGNNDNFGESQRNADENRRQGGRVGAMGGFNIRPNRSSNANRYNGSQRFEGPVQSISGQNASSTSAPRGKFEKNTALVNTENAANNKDNLEAAAGTGNAYLGRDPELNELLKVLNNPNDPIRQQLTIGLTDARLNRHNKNYDLKKEEINKMPARTAEERKAKAERLQKLKEFENSKEYKDYKNAYKAFRDATKNKGCSGCAAAADNADKKGAAASKKLADI